MKNENGKLKTAAVLLSALAVSLFFASCDIPANSNSSVTTAPNASSNEISAADTSGNSDSGKKGSVIDFGDDFVRGFDVSAVDYDEKMNSLSKTGWKNTDGTSMDFFKVLALNGVNTVRIRLWVDPTNAVANGVVVNDSYWNTNTSGDNTLERYISMAKRAKALGLKVMLDLHYSDYWTDPGTQVIPYSWQSLTTVSEMASKITEYTESVLENMSDSEVLPDYVQVGNEIDSGILLHTKVTVSGSNKTKTEASSSVKGSGDNFYTYLKAGCAAVRSKAPDAKIILHVTNRTAGITTMNGIISNGVDFDIVGLSYYPWEAHRKISDLKTSINTFKSAHGVMVVETCFHWNADTSDSGTISELAQAASNLIDPATSAVYSNLTTETSDVTTYIAASLSNSKTVIENIMKEVYDSEGIGVCTWGGERREDWKYGMFDWSNCKAMSNIEAFNYELDG